MLWNAILQNVSVSNFSETCLDQSVNSISIGEATKTVKNVVTNIGGLFSGSRNLCCISGFSPSTPIDRLPNIPNVVNIAIATNFLSMIANLML